MPIARIIDKNGETVNVSVASDGKMFKINGDIYGDWSVDNSCEVEMSSWLAPVEPSVYLCIAANYKLHAEECNMEVPPLPKIFMKNGGCVAAHKEPIRLPAICDNEVDYEAELAAVISKKCCNVSSEEAYD